MKTARLALGFAISIPTYVAGFGYVGLMLALGFAHKPRIRGRAMPVAVWRPWWAKIWRYSTTVGRGMCLHPRHVDGGDDDARIWDHERVHVRQHEDLAAMGAGALALFALQGDWWLGVQAWHLSQAGSLFSLLMAGLRLGWANAYREAEHERAAYSQTD